MVYSPTFTIKNQPNVGKYTSPMDPMGLESPTFQHQATEIPSWHSMVKISNLWRKIHDQPTNLLTRGMMCHHYSYGFSPLVIFGNSNLKLPCHLQRGPPLICIFWGN